MLPNALHFKEGELIEWGPRIALRMLWHGVQIGPCTMPRREIARRIWEVFKVWFAWTTALPGDRFWDFQRDVIVEVVHGLPGRRKARFVSGLFIARYGDQAFSMATPEPCRYAWWEVGYR